jgi:phage terminase small subunit
MPRKSAAALSVIAVDGKPPRLLPPSSLSEAERKVFNQLVAACEPAHFRKSDLPLLCRYCESIVTADQAALELRQGAVIDGKPSPWLAVQREAIKAMVALSMRLRLSPQSRLDPKTVGRKQPYTGRPTWMPGED